MTYFCEKCRGEKFLTVEFNLGGEPAYKIKSGKYRNVKQIKKVIEPVNMCIRDFTKVSKGALRHENSIETSPTASMLAEKVMSTVQCS